MKDFFHSEIFVFQFFDQTRNETRLKTIPTQKFQTCYFLSFVQNLFLKEKALWGLGKAQTETESGLFLI